MPGNLFTLPKQVPIVEGIIVPGGKLYFFATGTPDAQNTYTTPALSVAHDHPVEADAAGVFAPIYLDSSLPDYRVRLTDSAGVQLYQVDNVPAGVESALNFTVSDTAPYYLLTETDAASNNKNWRWIATAEQLKLQVGNDALDTWVDAVVIDRTANTVDLINLKPTELQLNGEPVFASGSFTGALTGFAANLTPTVQWRRSIDTVWLSVNAGSTGTSTTDAMTLGTLPASIRPAVALTVPARLTDNGTPAWGVASVATSGVITFGVTGAGSTFTSSGTKGLPGGWSLVFDRLRA